MSNHRKTLVCTVLMYDPLPHGARLMLDSAKYHGIDVHVVGQGGQGGTKFENLYQAKIVRLHEAIKNFTDYDHILFLDGCDSLFATGLGEIFSKFETYHSDFVIAGEHWCYPFARRYEQRTPGAPKRFRFLNSGFYLATWDAWRLNFNAILKLPPDNYTERGVTIQTEDQARFYVAWMEGHIKLTVDSDVKLCQCMGGIDGRWSWMSNDILWGKRPINKITGQAPCIIHCNGGEKWRLPEIWEMLRY